MIRALFVIVTLILSLPASALTCVPILPVWGTINYIKTNQVTCLSSEWAVFTAADLAAHDAAVLATAGGTTTTTGVSSVDFLALQSQVISMQSSIQTIATNEGYLPLVFNLPTTAEISQAWMIGFAIPMILYLTAWGYGSVVNSFRSRNR